MMKEDMYHVKILNYGPIKKSATDNEYRHIEFEDIITQKTIDYIIYSKKNSILWYKILLEGEGEVFNILWPGEVASIKVTQKHIEQLSSSMPLTIKDGDTVDIVVWYWDGWDELPEEQRVVKSMQDQIWRFRESPRSLKG
jgi:hypothetical protein